MKLVLEIEDIIGLPNALSHITQQGDTIMQAIQDFAAAQTATLKQIDDGLNALAGDVNNLDAQIAALTAQLGVLSPEDQAALGAVTASSAALVAKVQALDALTPPAP